MQPTSDIRPGDSVALQTGGPAMTVRACSHNLAYCTWPEGALTRTGTFELQTLVLLPRRDAEAGPTP